MKPCQSCNVSGINSLTGEPCSSCHGYGYKDSSPDTPHLPHQTKTSKGENYGPSFLAPLFVLYYIHNITQDILIAFAALFISILLLKIKEIRKTINFVIYVGILWFCLKLIA